MIDFRNFRKWKVFVSHDSEDKKLFVDPLVKNLQKRGTYLWYDKISIQEGEPIHDAIQKGLKGAKGGVVIFSPDFIKIRPPEERDWPKEEFNVLVYKKNTERRFLIPVFYEIDPEGLPETFKGPLDNIKGFTFSFKNKDDNINELSEKIHNRVKEIQLKERKESFLAILAILILVICVFLYFHKKNTLKTELTQKIGDKNINVAPFDTTKYNILILPFRNPDDSSGKSNVGKELENRLRENNELNKLGLDVKYLPYNAFDFHTKTAEIIGENIRGTNMVIWGTDSKPKDSSHQIYFHYVNISYPVSNSLISDEGKTEKIETSRLIEITEGVMRLEIDDIVYWFLGIKLYHRKDYITALTIFNKIENKKYCNKELDSYIACCYDNLQSFDKAKAYYEKILKNNPDFEEVHNNYAKDRTL